MLIIGGWLCLAVEVQRLDGVKIKVAVDNAVNFSRKPLVIGKPNSLREIHEIGANYIIASLQEPVIEPVNAAVLFHVTAADFMKG